MTDKVTIIRPGNSFDELDDFYKQTLEYLYWKYHYVPDPLPQIPLSEKDQIEMTGIAAGIDSGWLTG